MSGADWLLAVGMVLMLEGMLPFLSPAAYRDLLARMATLSDGSLRGGGLVAMTIGLAMMYLAR